MIPTAKEIIYKHSQLCTSDVEKDMIEFAKLHVIEALKQASEKAKIDFFHNGTELEDFIDKTSILECYPLENIK